MAKDFYKYDDPEDERLLLTPEMIKGNDRSELRGEIIYCIFVFLGLALMGGFTGFCIWRFHFAVNSPVSPYIITVPLMILTAYVLGFFICQIVKTVKVAAYIPKIRYRVTMDTLTKICEGESDKIPFFSLKNMGRQTSIREKIVTAYYFEKNGRASTTNLFLSQSDFPGDTFYLVIRNRDGAVMTAYNTKKYRLETENGTT